MAHVDITLPLHRYTVHIEPGLWCDLGRLVRAVAPHDRAAVLADQKVDVTPVRKSLEQANYHVLQHHVQPGESHKNIEQMTQLYHVLLDAHFERRSPVVAVGGGVVGDTVGFVAATYLRGVPFVQCPTTLLAMVDAAVGGKVGVNMPQGKNLIGAFYQPQVVVIDTDVLKTLPPRELRCGLAECVKHAIIRDPKRFDWLSENVDAISKLDSTVLVELVQWNVRIKAAVVMADEKEAGQRAHLNFGHTFAHAIEATQRHKDGSGYQHGEAVSLGMVAAVHLATDLGMCDAALPTKLTGLLSRIGLPTHAADLVSPDALLAAMRLDKKVKDSRIRLVLPDRMGHVVIRDDVPDEAITRAWAAVGE